MSDVKKLYGVDEAKERPDTHDEAKERPDTHDEAVKAYMDPEFLRMYELDPTRIELQMTNEGNLYFIYPYERRPQPDHEIDSAGEPAGSFVWFRGKWEETPYQNEEDIDDEIETMEEEW